MPYKSFLIPVRAPDGAERELNAFIQSHRVLAVDRRWVDNGSNSFWSVWVDYLDASPQPLTGDTESRSKKRVDYREVLSPEDFDIFAQLRVLRKELAAEDGTALYNVFTNEQLARIVQERASTKADLERIFGAGQARVNKYGPRVLDFVNKVWKDSDEGICAEGVKL